MLEVEPIPASVAVWPLKVAKWSRDRNVCRQYTENTVRRRERQLPLNYTESEVIEIHTLPRPIACRDRWYRQIIMAVGRRTLFRRHWGGGNKLKCHGTVFRVASS